jgi:oxygen-independent coproporphyrinogen-3 oxidase
VFANQPPVLPDDDTASDMLDLITARTAAAGLARYEVSAFARSGHRCAHNLNYWHFGDYLGLGAGAHGKLSFPERIVRQVRWREPAAYMAKALAGQAVSNEHTLAAADLPFEFMLNALRLKDGFELGLFAERTGLSPTVLDAASTSSATCSSCFWAAESVRVFRSCPLATPNDARSSLQMRAVARATAVLCA